MVLCKLCVLSINIYLECDHAEDAKLAEEFILQVVLFRGKGEQRPAQLKDH